jgi:hypothetical protein
VQVRARIEAARSNSGRKPTRARRSKTYNPIMVLRGTNDAAKAYVNIAIPHRRILP